MRRNEFNQAVAARIASNEPLELLYERIIERAAYTPIIGRIREVGLRQGWSVARTLAAMTFMLMMQNEANMEELEQALMRQEPPIIQILNRPPL